MQGLSIDFTTNAKAEPTMTHQTSLIQDYSDEGPRRTLFNALGYIHWDLERRSFREEIEAAKVKAVERLDGKTTWAEYKKLTWTEPVVHMFKSILTENRKFTVPQGCADNTLGTETPVSSPTTSANATCAVVMTISEISKRKS